MEAAEDPRILPDPAPFAALDRYGDSAVHYVLRFWTKTEDYWDMYYLATGRVQGLFQEAGIEMTYPHLNVHVDSSNS